MDLAGPRSCRARRLGRVELSMGGATILLFSGCLVSLSDHGVLARRRSHDYVDPI